MAYRKSLFEKQSMSKENVKKCGRVWGSVSDESQFDSIIETLQNFDFWCYIYHDSDTYEKNTSEHSENELKPKHLHWYVIDKDSRSVKTWSNIFNLPENLIWFPRSVRGTIRYLTHIDNPEKYRYPYSSIKTNNADRLLAYFNGSTENSSSVITKFKDWQNLRKGIISPIEYIELHRIELDNCNFYQQTGLFNKILDNYRVDDMNFQRLKSNYIKESDK